MKNFYNPEKVFLIFFFGDVQWGEKTYREQEINIFLFFPEFIFLRKAGS